MRAASALIRVMIQAAQRAAWHLRRDFGELENLQGTQRRPSDFVSRASERSEEVLRGELLRARPRYGFFTIRDGNVDGSPQEEGGVHRWVVDPLDGATNFLHGIPHFSVSVILEYRGTVVAAVVHNPVTGETYFAEKGSGAFLNDTRLRVAKRGCMGQAVVVVTGPGRSCLTEMSRNRWLDLVGRFHQLVSGMRSLGSSVLELAFVAAGRFDAYVADGLTWWDIAAGQLLVSEAGGVVSDFSGQPLVGSEGVNLNVLVSGTHLRAAVLDVVTQGSGFSLH